MELQRRINGREYTITVNLEARNAPNKRWVAFCKETGLPEEVGATPAQAVRKLERKLVQTAS